MSFTDDSSDSDWKTNKMKTQKMIKQELNNASLNKPKYFQKFCDKWLNIFNPWLTRCEDDQNKPFCRACQCRLDCNRCHLQRHERTSKHARNLEILISKGEGAARQNLSIRQERSKYYQQRKKLKNSSGSTQDTSDLGMDTADDFIEEADVDDGDADTAFQFVQTETPGGDHQYTTEETENLTKQEICSTDDPLPVRYAPKVQRVRVMKDKKDRVQILMQIQKDRNEMMDSFKELVSTGNGVNAYMSTPPKDKNHVDLFFESVSSSVKALSPKLIAETKMRVSQLICELELRALTENDANTTGATAAVVVSPESGNTYITTMTTGDSQSDGGQEYQALS